jgi:hypothetical protein
MALQSHVAQGLRSFGFINFREILGFCSSVVEVFVSPGYGAVFLGDWLPTFRHNLVVSSAGVEMSENNFEFRL